MNVGDHVCLIKFCVFRMMITTLLGLDWFQENDASLYPNRRILRLKGKTLLLNSMNVLMDEDDLIDDSIDCLTLDVDDQKKLK